ncbi:hypothetical protein BALAC2494_01814 [Bifidobacterium animalis subsp. lactis CNCM I-2494]|uniref:Uncharacterized protein n=1 Tax=Bifidobacterium animalis subsp. lactis CNCM I-2494 TaxID=1042403 RepID=A0A806FS40_BIFAN|nr:hypothetical protein BALAC2494_01814 [Bifidobacterium animalis subsp. lactis CNCM I-2494]
MRFMQEHIRYMAALHLSGMEGKGKIARIARGLRGTHHFNIGFLHRHDSIIPHTSCHRNAFIMVDQ